MAAITPEMVLKEMRVTPSRQAFNMISNVLTSSWWKSGSSKSTKTIIAMAECAINGVRHRLKELEVAPSEIRWKYIRGLVSR